jgi:hypothetical protein
MWRFFAPHVEAHASTCLANQLSTESFALTGPVAAGGSSAVPVKMQSGLRAYAKPARVQPGDVARERLTFVLGYRLQLPVASVLISRETVGLAAGGLPSVVALSFEMLAQGRVWGQIAASLTAVEVNALRPTFSAMHAFHAWIDEHDHFGGSNMQIERGQSGIQASFYDYSFSLTHQWQPPALAPFRNEWQNPPAPYANPDPLVMDQIVAQVQGFPLVELESIVGALPIDCLSQADGAALAQGLFERGKQLKTVLNLVGTP